jgi:archaemetzincin
MNGRIRIVPVNAIETAFLDRLALCIEERFLTSACVERSLAVTRSVLNSARKQLFLSTLTAKVLRAFPEGEVIRLVVTDFDLYKTSHRFIFGDGDEGLGVACVSLHRLRSEFYGEAADANQLFQRTLKESVHQIGHALGLKHCFNARCAMYYSNSIFETDNKMPHYCEVCERRLSRARKETER